MPSISAVLPAYNEEAIIGDTVQSMLRVLRELADDHEVIVVNDGSLDATAACVAAVAREEPGVRLISHPQNRGYGAALASGFTAATKDWVFLTDGDKQFDVRELAGFVPEMAQADLVVGFRHPRRDPLLRRLNGWGWNLVVRVLFGKVARDVDCAFKLFRREVWLTIDVESGGATFSAEFLIKARRAGFRVRERRVTHLPRTAGRATGARPDVVLRAFRDIFRLRRSLPLRGTVARRGNPAPRSASEHSGTHGATPVRRA